MCVVSEGDGGGVGFLALSFTRAINYLSVKGKSLSLGTDLKHKRGRVTRTAGMTTPLASGVMCKCVCASFH